MDAVKLGTKIAELRKAKGLTQKELASRVGVTNKAVSKWERGLNFPDLAIMGDLAKSLDTTVAELLSDGEVSKEEIISEMAGRSKEERSARRKKILKEVIALVVAVAVIVFFAKVSERDRLCSNYDNAIESCVLDYEQFIEDCNFLIEGGEMSYGDFSRISSSMSKTISNIGDYLPDLEKIRKIPNRDISYGTAYDIYFNAYMSLEDYVQTMAKAFYLKDGDADREDILVAKTLFMNQFILFANKVGDTYQTMDLGLEPVDDFIAEAILDHTENGDEDLQTEFTKMTHEIMEDAGFTELADYPEKDPLGTHFAEGGSLEKDKLGSLCAFTTGGIMQRLWGFRKFVDYFGRVYYDYKDMDISSICAQLEKSFGVKADSEKIRKCFESLAEQGEKMASQKDDRGMRPKGLLTDMQELTVKTDEYEDAICLYCDCILGYMPDPDGVTYRIRLSRTRDYGDEN